MRSSRIHLQLVTPEADLQVRVPREGGVRSGAAGAIWSGGPNRTTQALSHAKGLQSSWERPARSAQDWPPAFAGDTVKKAKEKKLKDKPAKSAARPYAPLPDALPLCVLVAT